MPIIDQGVIVDPTALTLAAVRLTDPLISGDTLFREPRVYGTVDTTGVADATAAIAGAIAAAHSTYPGAVRLPPGRIRIRGSGSEIFLLTKALVIEGSNSMRPTTLVVDADVP